MIMEDSQDLKRGGKKSLGLWALGSGDALALSLSLSLSLFLKAKIVSKFEPTKN